LAYEPRLHHRFPSMVDDWNAIATGAEQWGDAILLGNPEDMRYRPAFDIWSAIQWHTLSAPAGFMGPQLWGLARLATLVLGVTLLAVLLVPKADWSRRRDHRWLLTLAVPLAALTVPAIAVDIARFGPQEPLLVGCMSLGAVILVRSLDLLLDREPMAPALATAIVGLGVWSFGVLQKESSICILALAPFLIPTFRVQATRWTRLAARHRAAVFSIGVGVLLPLLLMVSRVAQLATADERVYGEIAARRSHLERLVDQLTRSGETLATPFFGLATCGALALTLLAMRSRDADWLGLGLLASALCFVLFAAESGVVASRYYLPAIVLVTVALARAAASVGAQVATAAAVVLVAIGMVQVVEAREKVKQWATLEGMQETLVRESAARQEGGCALTVIGTNLELVQAMPVLMPLADAVPRRCSPSSGERFVVVIDWMYGTTPRFNRTLAACGLDAEPVWRNRIGRIIRCSGRHRSAQRTRSTTPAPTHASPRTRGAVSGSPRTVAAPTATAAYVTPVRTGKTASTSKRRRASMKVPKLAA